jgi:hypothetical protein
MPSAVNSPGFTAGKAPPQSEQKRRGTGTLNHQETLPFPTTLSISTVRQTGAISLQGEMVKPSASETTGNGPRWFMAR